MTDTLPLDPFGPAASAQLYVPRAASERALDRLTEWIVQGDDTPILLTGPPGLGKTQLLHVLAERLGPQALPLYLPVPSLPVDDLCRYALWLLGVAERAEPEARLLARAGEEAANGRRLVLLCDDASAGAASVAPLAELIPKAAKGLSVVLASDDAAAGRLRAALNGALVEVSLTETMSANETARYVRVRLAAADAPLSLWTPFDADALQRIHASSGGVPRRVNQAAGALLRAAASPLEALPAQELRAGSGVATPRGRRVRAGRRRASRRRQRVLRSVELALAALVAALAVLVVARLRIPIPPEVDAGPTASRTAVETAARPLAEPRPAEDEESHAPEAPSGRSTSPVAAPEAATKGSRAPTETARAEPPPVGAKAPVEPPPAVAETPPAVAAGPPAGATAEASTVAVNVNAQPWAHIEIDGTDVGVTPLAGVPLTPGPHRFRAELPDGRTLERDVEIGPQHRFVRFP